MTTVRVALAALLVAISLGAFVGALSRREPIVGSSQTTGRPTGLACRSGSGWVSFVSVRNGREQIYALNVAEPDRVVRISRLPGIAMDPAWSPDGRSVAFRWFNPAVGADAPAVYVADADGEDPRLLVENAAMPDWSPDGRSIAFANLDVDHRGISVVEVHRTLSGGPADVRIVTETDGHIPEEAPDWSPDGTRIAFTSHRSGSSDIWVVDADGTDVRDLTGDAVALDTSPDWSPDGARIVFGSDRDSEPRAGGDLYSIRPDGNGLRRLTTQGQNYGPVWSPDGRLIAFNSQRDGNSELYVMNPDGTDQRRLTFEPRPDGIPAWMPCGARP